MPGRGQHPPRLWAVVPVHVLLAQGELVRRSVAVGQDAALAWGEQVPGESLWEEHPEGLTWSVPVQIVVVGLHLFQGWEAASAAPSQALVGSSDSAAEVLELALGLCRGPQARPPVRRRGHYRLPWRFGQAQCCPDAQEGQEATQGQRKGGQPSLQGAWESSLPRGLGSGASGAQRLELRRSEPCDPAEVDPLGLNAVQGAANEAGAIQAAA